MTDLDYIPTPNAIGHSWAYQREPLFCGHAVSQMWLLHAAEGWPEGQTEAMAYSSYSPIVATSGGRQGLMAFSNPSA